MTTNPSSPVGHVYLLHLEPGLVVTGNRVARHYLGFAERDVDARVAQHLRRQAPHWSQPSSPQAGRSRSSACGAVWTDVSSAA